jgi:hypothetical protein
MSMSVDDKTLARFVTLRNEIYLGVTQDLVNEVENLSDNREEQVFMMSLKLQQSPKLAIPKLMSGLGTSVKKCPN